LIVRVMNTLSSPDATSGVTIAVSVKGADNLEFANPKTIDDNYTFHIQSEMVGGPLCCQETHMLGDSDTYTGGAPLVYMGEHVTSLRQLFRRTQFSITLPLENTDSPYNNNRYLIGRFPAPPGTLAQGYHVDVNADATNYTKMTTMGWMQPAFLGWRGSIIWHANLDAVDSTCTLQMARNIDTLRTTVNHAQVVTQQGGALASISERCYSMSAFRYNGGQTGMALTNPRTQTGMSVLAPMYSRFRMLQTDPIKTTLGSTVDETTTDNVEISVLTHPMNYDGTIRSTNANGVINMYCSAGTDFNLLFYLNAPAFADSITILPQP